MIKVCGTNEFHQLGVTSNTKNNDDDDSVSPPVELPIDQSTILSFSSYNDHTVMITRDGILSAIGNNEDGKIGGTLPKETLQEFTQYSITDTEGHTLVPTSAVCGFLYTLYLFTNPESNSQSQLAYIYSDSLTGIPLFLNIGNRQPVSLYGGYENSAVIDSEGGIIFIPDYESTFDNFTSLFEATFLPDDQKAVNVCCCDEFVVALSDKGKVFFSDLPESGNKLTFSIVKELESEVIADISGTCLHCLAVSEGGTVFALGNNNCGQIGLGGQIGEVDHFTKIEALNDHKIKGVFAGGLHSLFLTEEGKVLACGGNNYAQLPTESVPFSEKVFSPVESVVGEGASFCVAGDSMSAIFINCKPPNCPNKRV